MPLRVCRSQKAISANIKTLKKEDIKPSKKQKKTIKKK